MLDSSLVFGIRRHRSRLLTLAIALGSAALWVLHPSIPDATSEPLSLILLGFGLAITAQRLRTSDRGPAASKERDDARQLVPRT